MIDRLHIAVSGPPPIGVWRGPAPPAFSAAELAQAAARPREPVHIVHEGASGRIGVAIGGEIGGAGQGGQALLASLPPLYPEWLGDRSFAEVHGVRFPYIAGEMANGIATTRMVIALAQADLLGFFGAAGLSLPRVEAALRELRAALPGRPFGVNLIHSPNEPQLEDRVAELLIQEGVPCVSASAFMALTPAVVRCAAAGLHVDGAGRLGRRRHLFAKVSRPEVARAFMSPAPPPLLRALVERGALTQEEAALAAHVPVAEDVTVEGDSGGHTDNRPLLALLPAMLALRDELAAQHRYARPIRVGAAGGIGTPGAVAAAFALGAAYVMTGSVNQCAVESGLSEAGRAMLAQADLADVIMAPAADMFELGVNVQVLRRGTLFGVRAARLYELYRAHASIEEIPAEARARLERELFQAPLETIWAETRAFWQRREPAELARAEADARHRMALLFRWYLGMASRWAIDGTPGRQADYQIWCGPAMGAFNRWVAGSFLEAPQARTVVQIARNLLEGAAVVTRAAQLRSYGAPVSQAAFRFAPRPLS